MPSITANDIELSYDSQGSPDAPVILMIMGLGLPRAGWPPQLIEMLVAEGFRVVSFDNRDVGKSQLFDNATKRNMVVQALRHKLRLPVRSPYRLEDMMRDAAALLDALEIPSAHVVGASMGGMIAQLLAMHSPQKVDSLTSIMSTTGRRNLPRATREVTNLIMKGPAGKTDEDKLVHRRKVWRAIGSPEYPRTLEQIDEFLQRVDEGGMTEEGLGRQILAIMAAPSRVAGLQQLKVPTLVIHGDQDPLVPIECGRDTAQAVPGAQLEVFPGMGHDLPEELYGNFSSIIARHARSEALPSA